MKISSMAHPKDQIVAFMKRIYGYGMTTTSGGNLSIIDRNGDMWISPGGVDKGTLRREDIVCVKKDGTVEGLHKPSSEFPFHRAIYNMRPDIKAILHAHPPALVSFSIAGMIPDTAVLPNARNVCGEVGYAPYAIPGSEELGKNIAEVFAKGYNTILLENHGTAISGTSLLQAFQRFETLDFCARLISKASIIGKPQSLSSVELEFARQDRNIDMVEFVPDYHCSVEREIRYKMVELIRRSYEQMLITSTEGTFAARIDSNRFLITPSGMDRAAIDTEDLILVENNKYESGKRLSRAAWFCKRIFEQNKDINSIILSQPPNIMAFAVSGETFDARTIPESYILLRDTPMFDFGANYRDADGVAKTISLRNPVVIFKNDCLLTTGRTLLEAFDRMEVAEYSAKAVVAAQSIGHLNPINDAQVKDLVKAFKLID